jgi:hypothetical protein
VSAQLPSPPRFFKRYLGDILTVADSVQNAEYFLSLMRNAVSFIKIGTFDVGTRVNYLDLHLSLVANDIPRTRLPRFSHTGICRYTYPNTLASVQSELYRKPSDLVVLLDFGSNHPTHVKQGTLFGQLVRIVNISSSLQSAGYHTRLLIESMIMLRNLPRSLRWRLHRRVLEYLVRKALNWALHSDRRSSNNIVEGSKLRNIRIYVPKLVDTHFVTRVLYDFCSRLSVHDQRFVNACVHMQYTHSLLRVLKGL